ncbi:hypothetical protein [Roseimicrobium sp. ORNL1]|uniref:hypothetical protein n=1 Tax=Roseimicrobium sp. ORNL1 TaxID=2711231 RepID=UPI0013E1A4C8|nr:hypothetical protein [Roseimicrobium sp. ORNL1]QIE99964.1 hypothetical protein G5S37_10480 [Roseimicrobium sp. ORNL1]
MIDGYDYTNYAKAQPGGRLTRFNFGGGRSQAPPPAPKQEPIKFPKMPKIHIPPTPAPPPPAPPPPTATSAEVAQADEQTRRDLNRRKGLRKTVLAGETGGYGWGSGYTNAYASQGSEKVLGGGTLLGGGGQ